MVVTNMEIIKLIMKKDNKINEVLNRIKKEQRVYLCQEQEWTCKSKMILI